MDITTATPVEIDTVLAGLYREETRLIAGRDAARSAIRSSAKIWTPGLDREPSRFSEAQTQGTTADAIEILQARVVANGDSTYPYSEGAFAAKALDRLTAATEALNANRDKQAPLDGEFNRRGGWSRSFVAQHAHSSMHCPTCNKMGKLTRFGWLPEVSGMTEAEIVEALGSDACTVCFPSAPVNTAPSRSVFTLDEKEANAARDERAAAKKARDEKKAAKAITAADGSVLRIEGWNIETVAAAKMWLTDSQDQWSSKRAEDVQAVASALAAKLGTSVDEEIAAAGKRAARRR